MAEPFVFESRAPESSYVDAIWRTKTGAVAPDDSFMSLAETHWGLVITTMFDKTTLTVRGPETVATPSGIPENAEIFGVVFKLGTYMPHMPVSTLVDAPVNLPDASQRSFWLHGTQWELPTYDNVDTFIDRLIRAGMVAHEPVVEAALQGRVNDLSPRSVQRRFLNATGLTQGTVYQIQRARHAIKLLEEGVCILDAVDAAGYADQPHMTRALRHYAGLTPVQIVRRLMTHS